MAESTISNVSNRSISKNKLAKFLKIKIVSGAAGSLLYERFVILIKTQSPATMIVNMPEIYYRLFFK